MGWFSRKPRKDPADAVRGLREQAFSVEPSALGLAPTAARPHVWGVIMETGYAEGAATLVVFAEGTTSLYFSNGGGIIGAGAHATVRTAAEQWLAVAEARRSAFAPVSGAPPLPAAGQVRILLRTFEGTLAGGAAEQELGAGAHPLSQVFFAAHGVITAVREASPPQ